MNDIQSFKNIPILEIEIGMSASLTKKITSEDIMLFASISGDKNPIHTDDEYAKNTRYKKRIAHGLMSASYFSALFGTKMPGYGCVYVSQTLNFKRAIYIGDEVTATIKVTKIDLNKKRVYFDTVCKVKNKTAIAGNAEIYIP